MSIKNVVNAKEQHLIIPTIQDNQCINFANPYWTNVADILSIHNIQKPKNRLRDIELYEIVFTLK